MVLKETCHFTRCRKRSERQKKEQKQKQKLEDDAKKAKILNFWGDHAKVRK